MLEVWLTIGIIFLVVYVLISWSERRDMKQAIKEANELMKDKWSK